MLSQLRTAVVPPPPPSAHQFTRHPRPPPSQTVSGSHLSPLAPAPQPQQTHLINGHANGASSNNWTSVNHDPYIPFPHPGAMAGGPPWTDAEKVRGDGKEGRLAHFRSGGGDLSVPGEIQCLPVSPDMPLTLCVVLWCGCGGCRCKER